MLCPKIICGVLGKDAKEFTEIVFNDTQQDMSHTTHSLFNQTKSEKDRVGKRERNNRKYVSCFVHCKDELRQLIDVCPTLLCSLDPDIPRTLNTSIQNLTTILSTIKNTPLYTLLTVLEMRVAPILALMEVQGIVVSAQGFAEMQAKLELLQTSLVHRAAQCTEGDAAQYNLASPEQVSALLYTRLGVSKPSALSGNGKQYRYGRVSDHVRCQLLYYYALQ